LQRSKIFGFQGLATITLSSSYGMSLGLRIALPVVEAPSIPDIFDGQVRLVNGRLVDVRQWDQATKVKWVGPEHPT